MRFVDAPVSKFLNDKECRIYPTRRVRLRRKKPKKTEFHKRTGQFPMYLSHFHGKALFSAGANYFKDGILEKSMKYVDLQSKRYKKKIRRDTDLPRSQRTDAYPQYRNTKKYVPYNSRRQYDNRSGQVLRSRKNHENVYEGK